MVSRFSSTRSQVTSASLGRGRMLPARFVAPRPHDQHRTGCSPHHVLGRTAQQHVFQSRAPVGGEHDQGAAEVSRHPAGPPRRPRPSPRLRSPLHLASSRAARAAAVLVEDGQASWRSSWCGTIRCVRRQAWCIRAYTWRWWERLSRGSHGVNHNCPLWRSHGGLISGTQGNDAEDYCRTGNWQEVFTLPVSSGLLHNGDSGGVGCQLSGLSIEQRDRPGTEGHGKN
jgi:hypothetical protein